MKFASQSFPGELASNWYREDIRLAENRLRPLFSDPNFFIPHSFELIIRFQAEWKVGKYYAFHYTQQGRFFT